ncbi:MAG TPA: hypothetical protein VM368_09555, partial [Flavisolibacter sp.]|nr:hypothetical protein [Flavisolibacter sp.]
HVLFIIRELIAVTSENKRTRLANALHYFSNTTKQRSIAFVLSDFIDRDYTDALRIAGGKHDVVGVHVYDEMDMHLPAIGMLRIEDAETGEQKWVDTNNAYVRQEYKKGLFKLADYTSYTFKKTGCSLLHVRTDQDYVKVLQQFFISRNK